jgi:hypothetical protein
MITGVAKDLVMIGFSDSQIPVLTKLKAGDEIEIDNSVYLATHYFHRHQMPPEEFYVWEQFKNPDGTPKYVQRPLLPNYRTVEARDAVQSGRFDGKMIVVACLMDEAAYPWQADWYRGKVRAALGNGTDSRYRLYYLDHAMHVSPASYLEIAEGGNINAGYTPVETHIISYGTALQQVLRYLVAWVERGVEPPKTTNYRVEKGQVIVPPHASERLGIQPTVDLAANGGKRADVRVGQVVKLSGTVEAAPGTGKVVAAEWDFDGSGAFAVKEKLSPAQRVTLNRSQSFDKPGTYFGVLRAVVQRDDAVGTPFAQVKNLARVRIVVS